MSRRAEPSPPRPSHSVPSGLGGLFDVAIVEALSGDRVMIRVTMPRNPDFHGHEFVIAAALLQPLDPVRKECRR